ncbi:MAG: type I-MYXAN CRISPR-associated Cas8a1/Cmx1, partial [bacterium]
MGQLQDGLTWRLSDPGMGLLERAGLAALYMTLRAAEELKEDLSPLVWDESDMTSESVTVHFSTDLKTALTRLFQWAWQVHDGVLYLPAVHRDERVRDNSFIRVAMHNGITRTFLQHPRVQPKGEFVQQVVQLDEDRQITVSYQCIEPGKLKPVSDLERGGFFTRKGEFGQAEVSLSGWVFPGIAPRYGSEVAWRGPAPLGLLPMLAPIACLYQQLHSERGTWLFVVPDVRNIEEFDAIRISPTLGLDPTYTDVASLSDAGLRFLAEYTSHPARRGLGGGCRVVAMGKVGYYRSQSVRKGVVDVDVTTAARAIHRYRILHSVMGNRWVKRKVQMGPESGTRTTKRKKEPQSPQSSHFVSVPSARGRIAENLVGGQPWYTDLVEPLPWDRDALDRQHKSTSGISVERIWFNNLLYQRGSLMELVKEEDMWDRPEERLFVEAFWQILAALYRREGDAVQRGGSRTYVDRIEDLNEDVRRSLTRAKTRPLLRETIADLFARPVEKYR